jgi:hypothetical protein
MVDQFTDQEVSQLRGQGECFIHRHPREDLDFQDQLSLMKASSPSTVTGSYELGRTDYLVLCDTTSADVVVQLPEASDGREFMFVKTNSANLVRLVPTASQSINASAVGATFAAAWGCVTVKAVDQRFVVISNTAPVTFL